MWFKKRQQEAQGEEIDLSTLTNMSPPCPAKAYVNLLLIHMAGRGETERVLKQSEPLPIPANYDLELPSFSRVINRFKLMAQLEPVVYPEPKEGSFEMMVSGQVITVRVRAEDNSVDRRLVLSLIYGERLSHLPGT